uniref:Uncharacterized protein n=1 Tax=Attheya septentrionalis TaxID=420275 RepID=A0A7S2XMZ4_9STRA|mmetsp:Transcript_14890/g.27001  ORF Transcript_14890/g.27001 Transcript_14890/m.27001 type:complete len:286 (+) Transcript_14890:141-998(+)|eukprot:CAMPEP_0198287310 /NCGR_PEP_ID=MMETSP1449-20131203/6184_1 /TAXON_ID=420275 /ORGANISM="Attheya septentrionalis, Strain CCMP2084" /LENGTH=285 /DNA_ID=CAMNT_0043985255 /DNA_START=100 /DNA_END=957 /DNA_ORIENTATION=-
MMANKYYFAAAFLLGTASTAAFVLPQSGQSSSLSRLQKETPTPSFLLPFQQFSVEDVAARDVSMKSAALSTIDILVTSSIFGAAVFATISANKKNMAEEVEEGGDFSIPATEEAEAVEEVTEEVVVVEPVVEKKEPKVKEPKIVKEVKVSVVKEVKVPVVEEVTDEEIVEAVVEAVSVAEIAIKSPAKISIKSPAKDISTMRKSVTSTREGEEEKKRRLAAAAKAKQVPTKGKAAVEPVVEEEEPPAVVEEEAPAEPVKASGRKRKFLGKLVKKTIKPWKKWSDL